MRLIEAEQKLLALHQPVIQTRDVSACLNISHAQASKILDHLAKLGRFVRLMRGKWATTTKIDPLILPEYMTAPFPSYVSLQTALFYHGIIEQIPNTIYAVSLARTRQYTTPFGKISIHHFQPNFFFGFEMVNQIKIATPEKALIDILYLTPARSNLFRVLPEIEVPSSFNRKKLQAIIDKISSVRTKSLVERRIEELLDKSV
jgi:predicted transcriptional regulator of viral defense system